MVLKNCYIVFLLFKNKKENTVIDNKLICEVTEVMFIWQARGSPRRDTASELLGRAGSDQVSMGGRFYHERLASHRTRVPVVFLLRWAIPPLPQVIILDLLTQLMRKNSQMS